MFTGEMNKAWAAAIISLLILIETVWGFAVPNLNEETIIAVLAVVAPVIVWAVPNWRRTT
jgi:hypothetical protein